MPMVAKIRRNRKCDLWDLCHFIQFNLTQLILIAFNTNQLLLKYEAAIKKPTTAKRFCME